MATRNGDCIIRLCFIIRGWYNARWILYFNLTGSYIFVLIEKNPAGIIVSYDLVTNWYRHIKLSVSKRIFELEAKAKQSVKRSISLDDFLLAQCRENQMW